MVVKSKALCMSQSIQNKPKILTLQSKCQSTSNISSETKRKKTKKLDKNSKRSCRTEIKKYPTILKSFIKSKIKKTKITKNISNKFGIDTRIPKKQKGSEKDKRQSN